VNDLPAPRGALQAFQACTDRPTLIICRSHIGWGSPNLQDTSEVHGAPLGAKETRLTKQFYGWPEDESFRVPAEVIAHFRAGIGTRGKQLRTAWEAKFKEYRQQYPELAEQIGMMRERKLPTGWDADIEVFAADAKGMASRASSGKVLNQVAKNIPWLLGGSADLAPSNKTMLTFDEVGRYSAENPAGRNFHFGIREHAMGAIANGMALCGLKPYIGTFFVFSDYMRPPIRMAAMMQLPVLYVFTHDSIGVGEDGPTHQPVEQLASLRAIPNLLVIRPADANEVAEAYRTAVALSDRPAALVLTRQNLPTLDRTVYAAASGLQRGGYVLADAPDGKPDVILIGTGSELSLCVEAREQLAQDGIQARVVSMPCWELFDAQPAEYRAAVLPPDVTARVAVEAGIDLGWARYIGDQGRFVGMRSFGASAPYEKLYSLFAITRGQVVAEAKAAVGR